MVLRSLNMPGNLHQACHRLNMEGLADHVIHLESSGHNSIIVLRVPADLRSPYWTQEERK